MNQNSFNFFFNLTKLHTIYNLYFLCTYLDEDQKKSSATSPTAVTNAPSAVVTTLATSETADSNYLVQSVPYKGSLVCIGVLPGLASYSDSSNSDDDSSDSERGSSVPRDLCGRQILTEDDGESEGHKKKK